MSIKKGKDLKKFFEKILIKIKNKLELKAVKMTNISAIRMYLLIFKLLT